MEFCSFSILMLFLAGMTHEFFGPAQKSEWYYHSGIVAEFWHTSILP